MDFLDVRQVMRLLVSYLAEWVNVLQPRLLQPAVLIFSVSWN
jgi:hypothetical protein